MGKRKLARQALGHLTREDGVRVEIKSPTVWATLVAQRQQIESLEEFATRVGAGAKAARDDRDRVKRAFTRLCEHPFVRGAARLGIVKLELEENLPLAAAPAEKAELPAIAR